jgi:hypothetical protein
VTPDGRRVVSASADRTLKVWDLETGRPLATLEGHAYGVNACAVTPDGRQVVSASQDRTLKVWDLETYTCLVTHRGDAAYNAVATSATVIAAGDATGGLWFLDWPPHQTEKRHMTREELLTRLSELLPSQFEEVLFRAKIPAKHLPGAIAPQATRAIEAIRYVEQQNQLDQLAQIIDEVVTGGYTTNSGPAGATDPP